MLPTEDQTNPVNPVNPVNLETPQVPQENVAIPPEPSNNKYVIIGVVIAIVFILLGAFAYYYIKQNPNLIKSKKQIYPTATPTHVPTPTLLPTPSPSPTPTPTPIPLHSGKATYQVSQGKHNGPSVTQVTFDPIDVRKGQTLTLTVSVMSNNLVTKVEGTLKTDNGQSALTFRKIATSDSDTTWRTELNLQDTVWYKYILTVSATDSAGTGTVTVAPRS